MAIRGFRLHRHPLLDLGLLVVALGIAALLLSLAGGRAQRVPMPSDSTLLRPESAMAMTRTLAHSFGSRVTGREETRRAAAWLGSRFDRLGLVTSTQSFPVVLRGAEFRGHNVVARSGGTEQGAIVLLAHYDGQTSSGQSAGDNAAGVGTLLELARVLETSGHRRPIIYVATDAEEWGMIGARVFAQALKPTEPIVAAISLDHVANGLASGVAIAGVGQGPGYAPLWLRTAAADAFAHAGFRTISPGLLEEWVQRTIRLSSTDQGPLVSRGVPAINLDVVARNPAYARFLYHTPGDRFETLKLGSFAILGAGAERLVHALDRAPRQHGPFTYLALSPDRMVRGFAILLAAIALFLPLVMATWESWRAASADPASRAALVSEVVRAGGWWVIAGTGLLVLKIVVGTGMLPKYELYPATVRDPFLYSVRWGPMFVVLVAMVAGAFALTVARRRLRLAVGHPLAGRAAALSTLVVLAALAIARNPFAAIWFLALPAWLWPWIGPTRKPLTRAGGILLVLASAVPFFAIVTLIGRQLELGIRSGYYVFLQSAYGAWSGLTTVMFVVAVLAASRLVGTATTRLIPAEGD